MATTQMRPNGIDIGTRTTTQRDALGAVTNGTILYNTTTQKVEVYDTSVPGWFVVGP